MIIPHIYIFDNICKLILDMYLQIFSLFGRVAVGVAGGIKKRAATFVTAPLPCRGAAGGPQAGKAALRRMCWGCAKALGEALKTTGSRLRRWPTWMLAQRRLGGANNEPRCFA